MNQAKRCSKCDEPVFMCECKPEVFVGEEVKEIYHRANHHSGKPAFTFIQLPTIIINHQAFALQKEGKAVLMGDR